VYVLTLNFFVQCVFLKEGVFKRKMKECVFKERKMKERERKKNERR